jgi:hypothetical protein
MRIENVSRRLPAFNCKTRKSVLSEHQATATGYALDYRLNICWIDYTFLTDRRVIHAKIGLRAVPGGPP